MLLASILPLVTFSMPNGEQVVFGAMGVYMNGIMTDSMWALMTVGAIASILALLTIFLYKSRLLQIRLTIFNTLLIIGFYLYAGFLFWIMTTSRDAQLSVGIAAVLPLVAIIASVLAIRRIYADEALVRSLSRLR
jgi:drug/metabolite transporter (DMT)-like permease